MPGGWQPQLRVGVVGSVAAADAADAERLALERSHQYAHLVRRWRHIRVRSAWDRWGRVAAAETAEREREVGVDE